MKYQQRKKQKKAVWRPPGKAVLEPADVKRLQGIIEGAKIINETLGPSKASKYVQRVRHHAEEIAPGYAGIALGLYLLKLEQYYKKMK